MKFKKKYKITISDTDLARVRPVQNIAVRMSRILVQSTL